MSIISSVKYLLALVCVVASVAMLVQMFQAETQTSQSFTHYAQWAVAGGVVFLLMGVAQIVLGREESVKTPLDPNSVEK